MKQQRTVISFFRKNAAYIVLALCVLAIGLSITIAMVNRAEELRLQEAAIESMKTNGKTESDKTGNTDPTDTETPTSVTEEPEVTETPVSNVISFIVPVERLTALEDYTETLAYNSTLKRFQAHKAIDFYAEEGSGVYAAYDGVISDVETTLLTGTTITIDHGDGLYTVYNSLADGNGVFVGQTVKQGAKIGEVSTSNRQESATGAHLHFSVVENGETINPAKYLSLEEK
ncbi:MAG: M23 family metallopeptidase [Clostridia bacterium]|nr:M23 family metallopeptidase [Clostridia bacterium]